MLRPILDFTLKSLSLIRLWRCQSARTGPEIFLDSHANQRQQTFGPCFPLIPPTLTVQALAQAVLSEHSNLWQSQAMLLACVG